MQKQGRVVVITGASAGVGRATAQAFGKRGCAVALLARDADRLEAAREEVENSGGRAITIVADVADADAVEEAAERVERELGLIDVWVNNAMASVFSPVMEMTTEEFKRVTDVTYLGYVYGTMAALRRMKPRDEGVIVQVGSALAYRSIPLQSAYCAAKHAVVGFTDSLRSELIHDRSNVKLTAVHLPAVNTPQFEWVRTRLPRKPQPVPPIFQPEVPAEAIVWASEHPRRELLVGGPTLQAVIGQKLIPGLLDRYLAATCYDGQQQDTPVQPNRPDNLYGPVPGPFGAHGAFDGRSSNRSFQFWATTHRSWIAAAAAGVVGLACVANEMLNGEK